jgi:hypothetical protein
MPRKTNTNRNPQTADERHAQRIARSERIHRKAKPVRKPSRKTEEGR